MRKNSSHRSRIDRTRPVDARYWYMGPLDLKKMGEIEAKAFRAFKNQKTRCTNPKVFGYKTYGARGIRVRYSSREFIGWYLEKIAGHNGPCRFEVGRVDHDKDYFFENIEIQTKSENSREMLQRTGNKPNRDRQRPVLVCDGRSGEPLIVCESRAMAAKLCGVASTGITRSIASGLANKGGFSFRSVDG